MAKKEKSEEQMVEEVKSEPMAAIIEVQSPLFWEPNSGNPRPKMNVRQKLAWVKMRLTVEKGRGKGHDKNAKVEYAFRNTSDILARTKELCYLVDADIRVSIKCDIFGENSAVDVREVRIGQKNPKGELVKAPTYALFSGPRLVGCATAIFTDIEDGQEIKSNAFAEQDTWRAGQGESEKRSGSVNSYVSKYALCSLLAIDDEKDADQLSNEGKIGKAAEEDPF